MDYRFAFGIALTGTPPQRPASLPARAFIVGVYPSAIHARWVANSGRFKCSALAVAPEPHSFWDGADAEERIASVAAGLPPAAGRLTSAGRGINGPSGRVLREAYLDPLSLDVRTCWVTDLHDSYYLSPGNRLALEKYKAFRTNPASRCRLPRFQAALTQSVPGASVWSSCEASLMRRHRTG